MKKKIIVLLCAAAMGVMLMSGCSGTDASSQETNASVSSRESEAGQASEAAKEETSEEETPQEGAALEDGVYSADFNTDSSMFHVNEANDGKGTLTVENGQMTIHISLVSENIVNLFVGTAEDAQQDGAQWLEPTADEVTYSDGTTEEVYGFDVPVPALDEEFDLAILGTKGTWYDHKVSVTDPEQEE